MTREERAREALLKAEDSFYGFSKLYRTQEAERLIVAAMLAFADAEIERAAVILEDNADSCKTGVINSILRSNATAIRDLKGKP